MTPSLLSRFVEKIELLPRTPGQHEVVVDYLPDGTTSLVIRWHGTTCDAAVRGPMLRPHYKRAPALPLAIRVAFHPGGAYPFFGVPLSALTAGIVPLSDVWGADATRLCDDIAAEIRADRDPVAVIACALVGRMTRSLYEPAGAMTARAAVRSIEAGATSVGAIARELGTSERSLLRAFKQTVGMAPKEYIRVHRFQRALARGRATPGRWSDIAREVGYFDQSHLISEFRAFAAASPTELDSASQRRRAAC